MRVMSYNVNGFKGNKDSLINMRENLDKIEAFIKGFLLAKDTIDEYILNALKNKKDLANAVVETLKTKKDNELKWLNATNLEQAAI